MSPYPATRRNGVCTGSLWKSHSRIRGSSTANSNSTSPAAAGQDSPTPVDPAVSLDGILAEANERQRAHEFCVLVGNIMWSYSDVWAYAKGDPPTSEIRIVGASAWNPPTRARRKLSSSSPAAASSTNTITKVASEATTTGTGTSTSLKSLDFLIVTYCSTHVRCSAPTTLDKEEWLAALHSGLEGSIMENRIETFMVLSNRHKQQDPSIVEFSRRRSSDDISEIESNSGDTDDLRSKSDRMVQSAIASAVSVFEAESSSRPLLPPLPRAEVRQLKKSSTSLVEGDSSATPFHSEFGGSNAVEATTTSLPLTGYISPCDDRSAPPSDIHCFACGRYPPEHAMRIDASPLPEYGMEVRVDLCHDCSIAEGVLRHVRYLEGLYEADARDRAAIRMAWAEVKEVVDRQKWENAGLEGEVPKSDATLSYGDNHESAKLEKSTTGASNVTFDAFLEGALLELVCNESFVAYRLSSNTVDYLCKGLEMQRNDGAQHFVESIEECAQAAGSSCFFGGEHELAAMQNTDRTNEAISMKKESFKVAGDMSAALKLLYQYALPSESRNLPPTSHLRSSRLRDDADMLVAILEFFLDLCEQGQIDAVSFFWPQLCHIHMQMLPPRDTEEMIRVELMEDFLLTVSIRYSVHLALNLVWGLTADLEEGLGSSTSSTSVTRRRSFAILRFVSELESLLFDFEGGWGGGGVSLRSMLAPTQHQATLLRDAMSLVQLRRRFGSQFLTRSVRLDNLRVEALERLEKNPIIGDNMAMKALIAQNAAYFSSQITFARKLGDIAEKLRFMRVEKRSETLRRELKEINESERMLGGDPLNRMCKPGKFQKTVHIPIDEGHVFRSKARTPVLLLAELVEDPPKPISATIRNDIDVTGTIEKVCDVLDPTGGHGPESDHDSSSQASPTSSSAEKICTPIDQDQREMEVDVCPESPSRHPIEASTTTPGCLSSKLLTLTPKVSDATNVTDEGKEMMADMIATLMTNKPHNLHVPFMDESDPDSDGNHASEVQISHQNTVLANGGECIVTVHPTPVAKETASSKAECDDARKLSALGSVLQVKANLSSADFSKSSGLHLTADGQFRRDVLFAIMERGMRGNNIIAKGAATAARRAIQSMDRKRALALMNDPSADTELSGRKGSVKSDISINASADEGEVIEALRLLIIQNQVAQENLSTENPAKSNRNRSGSVEVDAGTELTDRPQKGVDAGEVDHRLAGCGRISTSVLSALRLWKGGIVSNGELLVLVHKDLQFLKHSAAFGSTDENNLIEDSAFWGRFSYGERWAEKKARLAASSPHGSLPQWNLIGFIVKSNDDLRQEAFVMQLIVLCEEAFRTAGLDLWVHPYHIVATGLSTGIIECVKDAMSFDSLKKRPGYGSDGLVGHFQRMTEIAADPFKALNEAKQNFVSSLAAYSLMSYLFMFKDRHNGNLLLDTAGHVIHIDFGFVFGIAPGGSFSLEQSTPFKLTEEMLEVMGGIGSPLFSEFVTLFCCGFLALQAHADTFLTVVEVTCRGSNFNCFDGKDPGEIVSKLRERFCPDLNKSQTVAYALDLIKFATASYGTKQYDYYQYLSQGIAT